LSCPMVLKFSVLMMLVLVGLFVDS